MHSRKQSPVEAAVIQLAVVVEVEGVPEVDTAHDPKVDIINNPLTDEVNVPIVEHPTNQGNAQPMVKPAITVVRVVIMPVTAIQHSAHPLQGDIHAVIYMIWSRQRTLNMTLFRLFEKLPLDLTATRTTVLMVAMLCSMKLQV